MNRRQFLVAAAAIPALAKAIVAAPADAPITGILRSGTQEFEIIYPDGTVWSFAGMITAQSDHEITVRPSGAMTMGYRDMDEFTPNDPKAIPAYGTVISRNGCTPVELQDIALPQLTRGMEEMDGQSYLGLRRTGEITFCGKFL